LHIGDIDKLVGTKARHPVCRVSIFEIVDSKLIPQFSINELSQYSR